ncbi:MAG: carbohydrate ABC transporter permease [Thermomicrobiales bacterium]
MNVRKLVVGTSAVLFLLWTIVPLYWVVSMSLMFKPELLSSPTHFYPHHPTGSNYTRLFGKRATGPDGTDLPPVGQAPQIRRGLVNSTVVALSVVALTMLIALPVAYALGRLSFRGKNILLLAIITSRSYPPLAIIIPFYYFFTRVHLQSSLRGLVVVYLTASIPLVVWIMTGFFRSLPRTVEAAARVDGNTRFQAFYRVILPMSAPGVAVVAAIAFMTAWNEFAFAMYLTSGSPAQTFPPTLSGLFFMVSLPNEMAAALVLSMIPPAVLAYLFQSRIRNLNLVDPL